MTAKEWMKKHNLEIGDEVRVVAATATWMQFYPEYKDSIGKIFKLSMIVHNMGTTVRLSPSVKQDMLWTTDCLEPVLEEVTEVEEYIYKRKNLLNWERKE